MIKVKSCTDKSNCVLEARQILVAQLRKLKESNTPTLLCLSGGSALEIMKDFDFSVLGPHVTITVLDERYSTDPNINNMAQIYKLGFMDKALGCKVLDTRIEDGQTLESFVNRFNTQLSDWTKEYVDGQIVVTAGMGPDGHTSGIIPGSDNFEDLFMKNNQRYVVGYKAANQPEDRCVRATTNFEFLRMIAFAVLLVTGAEKQEGLNRVLGKHGSLVETPARIWLEIAGQVFLFSDLKV